MRKVCFALLLVFVLALPNTLLECPNAPAIPGDRRSDKTVLHVAQWNVQWLYDGSAAANHSMKCPGKCDWSNAAEAAKHLAAVAEVIDALDADILNLVEVEDCEVLQKLLAHMKTANNYKAYLKYGTDTSNGQNVALLTKVDPVIDLVRTNNRADYPVAGSNCGYKGTGHASLTQHYYTKVKVGSNYINLFGVHFIAHPDDTRNCAKREAQATVLRGLIDENTGRNDHVVIFGDFNDYDDVTPDQAGNVALSKTCTILKKGYLTNIMTLVDKSERWTSWWDKSSDHQDHGGDEHTQIDHILLSPALLSRVKTVQYRHLHKAGKGTFVSDHWATYAVIDTSDW